MMKVLGRFSMLDTLEGYTLIAYKNWIYVFGGQDTSGRIKVWNNSSFWKINIVTNHVVQLKRLISFLEILQNILWEQL